MKVFLSIFTLFPLTTASPIREYKHDGPSDAPAGTNSANALSIMVANWVSPWSDDDRSEIMSHVPNWKYCPLYSVNCKICPRDRRCQELSANPNPSSDRPNLETHPTVSIPSSLSDTPEVPTYGEPDALAGEQLGHSWRVPKPKPGPRINPRPSPVATFSPLSVVEKASRCPLHGCSKISDCGLNAKCVRGYCACKRGFKTSEANAAMGMLAPDLMAVFVSKRVDCDETCGDRTCGVEKYVNRCFDRKGGARNGMSTSTAASRATEVPSFAAGTDVLEAGGMANQGTGIVQKPGVDDGVGVTILHMELSDN
ncbi:hypothetical protein EJ04DRAFT_604666 [Polyplosphaeria fusca]|uniref:Uncharacterized protein n=1 Tax=Polyplosphaeria fusca TaxID=682080 RepID=A0A9P4R8E7_9PLEO|nr:hypothetical protein EJ04DRAFT_604666 [Polyplosphaeria fusca]